MQNLPGIDGISKIDKGYNGCFHSSARLKTLSFYQAAWLKPFSIANSTLDV
jgi:hypothetical protein